MQDDPIDTPITAEDVLAAGQDTTVMSGMEVRKGSVAAFVANARAFESTTTDDPRRDAMLAQLKELLPVLRAVGVLEVFSPRSPALSEALGIEPELAE